MIQAISRPTLGFSINSMQLPETVASNALTLEGSISDEQVSTDLLLYPGEPGEMLVMLENSVSRPLRWKLKVEGDFPSDWCRWRQPDFEEIASQEKLCRALTFQIPEGFFENQSILNSHKPQLQINYQSQVYVYAEAGTQAQLIGYRVFNLFVRPKSSYLDFLPTIYRQVDFVGRFLSIFEQAFDPAVQTLETLWAYLDPITAPKTLLPFLAHWVAWDTDIRGIDRQRFLIRNCLTLYRWHGTRYGLRLYLHLYTGLSLEQINITEIFEQGFVLGTTFIGEDSMLGGGRPYHFIVELFPESTKQLDQQVVRKIIESQKPAFCTYDLNIGTAFEILPSAEVG